jgi:hypothetical protein
MNDELKARVDVVVLDLSRAPAAPKPAKKAAHKTATHRKTAPKSPSPRNAGEK